MVRSQELTSADGQQVFSQRLSPWAVQEKFYIEKSEKSLRRFSEQYVACQGIGQFTLLSESEQLKLLQFLTEDLTSWKWPFLIPGCQHVKERALHFSWKPGGQIKVYLSVAEYSYSYRDRMPLHSDEDQWFIKYSRKASGDSFENALRQLLLPEELELFFHLY